MDKINSNILNNQGLILCGGGGQRLTQISYNFVIVTIKKKLYYTKATEGTDKEGVFVLFRQKVWCILNSKLGFYSHIRCVINSGAVCNTQLTSPATTFCHIPRGGWGKTPPRHLSVHLHAQGGIGNPPPRKGKREKKGDELFLTIKDCFLSKPFPPPPPQLNMWLPPCICLIFIPLAR